ncbi:MAG: hypothetical protein WAQ57_00800 [Candidatus Saccharimonadales bacterium]
MIQFNLLPQVKLEYIRTKRLKRLIMAGAVLAAGTSVVIVILSISMAAVQKKHLSNLDKDIAKLTAEINDIPDLNKMLSVQNQLNTLPGLYAGRPAVKRLPTYLDQTTPTGTVNLGRMTIDFSTSKMEIAGSAVSLEAVNRYADTIKFTSYKAGEAAETKPAFSNVVLSAFGRDDKGASFTIMLDFDPVIFDGAQEVSLVIPSIVTTRSQVQTQSSDLFNGDSTGGAQ